MTDTYRHKWRWLSHTHKVCHCELEQRTRAGAVEIKHPGKEWEDAKGRIPPCTGPKKLAW